ncbi:unnamed protein product [Brassica oleracea var. botrytis]
MARPIGVKAAKGKGKRTMEEEGNPLMEFQSMWEIRQKDFALKEKLNKQKLLDILIAKTEPLSELEIGLKNKLINDMSYASLEMRDSYVWSTCDIRRQQPIPRSRVDVWVEIHRFDSVVSSSPLSSLPSSPSSSPPSFPRRFRRLRCLCIVFVVVSSSSPSSPHRLHRCLRVVSVVSIVTESHRPSISCLSIYVSSGQRNEVFVGGEGGEDASDLLRFSKLLPLRRRKNKEEAQETKVQKKRRRLREQETEENEEEEKPTWIHKKSTLNLRLHFYVSLLSYLLLVLVEPIWINNS